MANNDIHYIRKELDNLQARMRKMDIRTEYALSESDTVPPTTGWSEEKPAPTEGYFIWARNILNFGYGDIKTEPFCIGDGQEHILSIDVEYIAWSDPYLAPPQDSPYWQTTAPSIVAGQYIWTRTVVVTTESTNYTDPLRVTGLQGERGSDGIDGKAGKDGKGLEFIFYRSATQINWNSPPQGVVNPANLDPVQTDDYYPTGWTDDQTEVTEQYPYQYVSTRTKVVATGETTALWTVFNTPKLWSVYGEKPYCHIRYADVNNPLNWNETFPNPQTSGQGEINYHKYEGYLWNADEVLKDVDKDPTKFTWRIYRPTVGVAGEEGSFLHIAYADDEYGTGFNQYSGAYMGTCVTWEETDPDDPALYNWVKIEGNGIESIVEEYALHTSYSTAPTTGWSSTKQTYVLGKYYWTRSVITYTDGTTEITTPVCVTGLDGTGVNNVFYCCNSLSTPSTPSWSDVHDNSSTESQNYDKWVKDPVAVTSSKRYIYISSSTTHTYTNGVKSWTNFSAPVLWGRYAVDGQNGQNGQNGTNGTNGTGYEYAYYTSNSATAPTKPTGDVTATSGTGKWTTVPVPMTSTYKYMYISYRTVTGSTKSAWSNSALWSQFGEKGDDGENGVDGNNITPNTVLTKNAENNLSNTTIGAISNQVASDFVSSEIKSETITNYEYKFGTGDNFVYFHKQGNIVTVNYNLMVRNNVPSTYTTIFNVPNWAVPINEIYLLNIFAHFNYYRVLIRNDGRFQVASNGAGDGTQGVNIAGSTTYIAKDMTSKIPVTASFVSTTIAQGGVLTARITPSSGELLLSVPIYFRINGVLYQRNSYGVGEMTWQQADLNINLNAGTYTVTAWYDGAEYTGGYYIGGDGVYSFASKTQTITVQKCTNPTITFGKESAIKCWVRVMNGSYPLRNHDVTITHHNHSFIGNTDGNGYVYFNLDKYTGKSVSVTASISNTGRCDEKTTTGTIIP